MESQLIALAAYFLIAKSPSQVRHSHETPQPRLPILRSCARKSNTPPQNWGKPHVHRHISDASASPLTSLGGEWLTMSSRRACGSRSMTGSTACCAAKTMCRRPSAFPISSAPASRWSSRIRMPLSHLPVSRDRACSPLARDTAPPRIDVAAAVPVAVGPSTFARQPAPQPQVPARPIDHGLRRPVPGRGWLGRQASCGRHAATWPNVPIAGGCAARLRLATPQLMPLTGIHPLLTRSLTVTLPG
jgi:hypothetical protein